MYLSKIKKLQSIFTPQIYAANVIQFYAVKSFDPK